MQLVQIMATMNAYDLHDHAGLRWLLPFSAAFVITVLTAVMMLLYPHLFG